eukprot:CAMPEP_0183351738 /NCGR_PEP_ID=MMETSP0164_2-20130417/26222_1 /TAXON_ID=221442 /ORGANISM="Coccolithus pelagicus ssp braarudi, Strain PLY182g" /LENGTH=175 /DNA_ID=CAMNT_0025523997 /DNA_START=13 /DNA_END=540 /DNA_ORIENTATION=-
MANEGAKKRVIKNAAFLSKTKWLVLGTNGAFLFFRAYYLWASFSNLHMLAFAATSVVYLLTYMIFASAAQTRYDEKGNLLDGGMHDLGEDLNKGGMIEYAWDMILLTIFVQITTALISDWFWLLYLIPPGVGSYFLWVKMIYPWISKPDAPSANELMQQQQMQGKGGRAKYSKAR